MMDAGSQINNGGKVCWIAGDCAVGNILTYRPTNIIIHNPLTSTNKIH